MNIRKVIGVAVVSIASLVQGGTFVQNVEFPETGLFLDQQVSTGGVGPLYTATIQRTLGQAFVLSSETTLSAITVQKNSDLTVPAGGTNELALWIGEVTTNGVPVSTNYTGLIDLSDQSFVSDIFCSVNLDAAVVLPAGRYAFQMAFTTSDAFNNFNVRRDGDLYADGGLMYGQYDSATEAAAFPFTANIGADDIVFGLHSNAVSVVSMVQADPDEVNLFYTGGNQMTGTVAVSYFGETDVDLLLSISDESHAGAFSILSASPQTVVDPSPSNTVVEFQFDNGVANLADGQSATGLLHIAWNDQGTGSGVVTVPLSVEAIPNAVIPLVPDAANSAAGIAGTVIGDLVNDPFSYNPLDPNATVPALAYTDGFHGGNSGTDLTLSFTLTNAYTTVASNPIIVLDAWGRNSNMDRDDDFDVILYNGDYFTEVGRVEGVGCVNVASDPYGRGVIDSMPVGSTFDRLQIIGHDDTFTLTEVRLGSIPGTIVAIVPDISASVTTGAPPLTVVFDGSGTTAGEPIASYSWDFGDGNVANGVLVTNTYMYNGPYTAELTVTGTSSNSASKTVDILVDLPEHFMLSTSVAVEANAPTASSIDLAQEYYLSSEATGLWDADSQTNLFNGLITNDLNLVRMHTDGSVTINLDVSNHFAGFDLTGITTYFGSGTGGGGRANQGYRVVVTYIDDTTETLIGADLWESAGSYWTTVSFAGTNDSVLATGIKAVTIDQIYPANAAAYADWTLPLEFDIFGSPSLSSEPPVIVLNGTAMSWATTAAQNYEIQSRHVLNIGDWTTYTNVVGTPPETTFEMPVTEADTQFFRVNL